MFVVENTSKKNRNKSPKTQSSTAQIAEESDTITTRELDEYIKKGKNLESGKNQKKDDKNFCNFY